MLLSEVSVPIYNVALAVLNNYIPDGRREEIHFDKITSRIQKLCYNLNMDFVDPVSFACY